MKLGILKEIDWTYAGALLANEDENAQAAFFKGFVKECLSWETGCQVDAQLAAVSHCLTNEEKEVLEQIVYKDEDD